MHFWLFLGRNVEIVKLGGKDRRIVFRHFQAMSGVIWSPLALSISIIQEIGNIKRYCSGNILYKDCFTS